VENLPVVESPPEPAIADEVDAGPSRVPIRLYAVLAPLTTLGPLSLDMYLPGLPAMTRDLHASESAAQLTLTACFMGLALGQLVAGPISDRVGRRRPLLVGLAAYAIASLVCALAPTIPALIGLRLLQGLAGGSAGVIAVAIVRDRYTGRAAAKLFSLLILVTVLSPLLAPLVGGQLLLFTSWPGIFVALAGIGILLLGAMAAWLPETHPPERRRTGGLGPALATLGALLGDRPFMSYALPSALSGIAILAYLAGSSFVLQEIYGVSPQMFGALFGINGIVLAVFSQVNRRLLDRHSPEKLFRFGLALVAAATLILLAVVLVPGLGLVAILLPLLAVVAGNAFVAPNATAMALAGHREAAGSGAALLGIMRFGLGAVAAPLVGSAGPRTALPLALVMAAGALSGFVAFALLRRPANSVPAVQPDL
jgi:DHA1 family bicyclomycin/chloramphenicol resistance-like MFS transporter